MDVKVETRENDSPPAERLVATKRLRRFMHDLRAPLNVIIGMTELLTSGEIDPSSIQHREFLEDVLTAGRRLLQLVDDASREAITPPRDDGSP